MRGRRMVVGAATAAWLGAAAVAGLAQESGAKQTREEFALQIGKQKYTKYCATCHGPDANGDGVAARLFTTKPPDLTLLAKENGGKFPMNELLNVVKGNASIAAHGNREMPVWGEILGRPLDTSMNKQAEDNAEVLVIGHYLESIQKK